MKRNIFTISMLAFLVTGLAAQNEQDVLRYSFIQTGGTTRSLSMGGALGAVGGDFASLAINPAGLGIFRSGEFSITADYNANKTKSTYLDNPMTNNGYKLGISQFGVVVPLKSNPDGNGFKGLTFGIGYNKLKDYGQNFIIKGVNQDNSLVDVFVDDANAGYWDDFSNGLAWESYLFDFDSINQFYYSKFTGGSYGETQRRTVNTSGYLGEYDFSLGTNLSDRIYLGATLGVQQLRYNETWTHMETDPENRIPVFNDFTFNNTLSARGSGVNLKVGILARPLDFLRIGASVQTPTTLKINDDFRADMETNLTDGLDTHTYEANGSYDYSVSTPLRATASAAFIFKQYGLISFDYEYVDYSTGRLHSSEGDKYAAENEAVAARYKACSNFRLGGELRLMGSYYLRAGYSFYGSPYVTGEPNAGKNLNIFAGGVGYRDNTYYVDLGLSAVNTNQDYFLYWGNSADVKTTYVRVAATLGIKF